VVTSRPRRRHRAHRVARDRPSRVVRSQTDASFSHRPPLARPRANDARAPARTRERDARAGRRRGHRVTTRIATVFARHARFERVRRRERARAGAREGTARVGARGEARTGARGRGRRGEDAVKVDRIKKRSNGTRDGDETGRVV